MRTKKFKTRLQVNSDFENCGIELKKYFKTNKIRKENADTNKNAEPLDCMLKYGGKRHIGIEIRKNALKDSFFSNTRRKKFRNIHNVLLFLDLTS